MEIGPVQREKEVLVGRLRKGEGETSSNSSLPVPLNTPNKALHLQWTLPSPPPQSASPRRGADYTQISVPPPDPQDRIPLPFLTTIQPVLEAPHLGKLHARTLHALLPSICPNIFVTSSLNLCYCCLSLLLFLNLSVLGR